MCVCVYVYVYVYVCVCVCVCVCVTYVYLTLNLFHTIPDADYLRLPDPFAMPYIRRLQWRPCYTPTPIHQPIPVLDLFYSRPFPQSLIDLTTPGRKQCHHRPIRHLRSLSDACPFVSRAAEEQDVRPHYF